MDVAAIVDCGWMPCGMRYSDHAATPMHCDGCPAGCCADILGPCTRWCQGGGGCISGSDGGHDEQQRAGGAELPRPQTQSRLKAHSLSPAHGPASVARRSAPRGTSSRRQGGGPHGERGATQEPHTTPAQNTDAVYCASLLALPPSKPGPDARGTPLVPGWAVNSCHE